MHSTTGSNIHVIHDNARRFFKSVRNETAMKEKKEEEEGEEEEGDDITYHMSEAMLSGS